MPSTDRIRKEDKGYLSRGKMQYISQLKEEQRISEIYLCKMKQTAATRGGKPYINVTLQDKTGSLGAKIWEPNSSGIEEFDVMDYVQVVGDVTLYQGALQLTIKRCRKASKGEYTIDDYLPVSPYDPEEMYKEMVAILNQEVTNLYLRQLIRQLFIDNPSFINRFKKHSAAKSVHHSFVSGLLHHTLRVLQQCQYYCSRYPQLNKDLLYTAAVLHDIGKMEELSSFPMNDYTDGGQLLGHIMIGIEQIGKEIDKIEGFPKTLAIELKHCILAHHGELEYGSPKKPALLEALALHLADNTDAKMETFIELLDGRDNENGWLGYQKLFDSNIRRTSKD